MFKNKRRRYFPKKIRKSQSEGGDEEAKNIRKKQLEFENLKEDKLIKNLEKKLKLNKKSSKSVPKSFMCDGLDYILDVCNEETRKIAADSEKHLSLNAGDESDSSYFDDDEVEERPTVSKKSKKFDKKEAQTTKQKMSKNESYEDSDLGSESDDDHDDSESDDDVGVAKKSMKNKKFDNKKEVLSLKQKKAKIADLDESDMEFEDYDDLDFDDDLGVSSDLEEKTDDDDDDDDVDDKLTSKGKKRKLDKPVAKQNSQQEKKRTKKDLKNSKDKKSAVPAKKQKISVSEDDEEINDFEEDDDSGSDKEEANEEEGDGTWEDIYGRKRNKDGSVVAESNKYVAPAKRFKDSNPEKSEKLIQLKRQLKGLLNRLAESNMHSIVSQLDELYMCNSRNDMNEMITNLMLEAIVAPVFTPERLIIEQMMCIAVLHANVGTEVGAHVIMTLVKKFTQMIERFYEVENKELDNLVMMICHLYNFKVFGSQLIYQILNKLIEKFTEKEIEIILIILKTAGFGLRKDDSTALKELVFSLQQKAASAKSTNTRVKFMIDVLLAIKNNNMNKIPQYDQSHVEHLKKVMKTLIRKGNSVSQLNLSMEDLLNADENGKWWIVGSAWAGKALENNREEKKSDDKPVFSKKILALAKAQRMNTDVRRNIFCVLMTAEDYLDAFEKLHHLGLKERQEREIIYVIMNCCLQEKKFNPYYAVLLQKFCDYDRKYQMTIQYTLWDKFKMLNNYDNNQLSNMAKMISYLFINKALPLSILKVIELGELDASTMKLFKKIMLNVLLYEDTETCLQVFERIAPSERLHQFREGLRLFINYFLVKNIKKEKISPKRMELLEKRIQYADKILMHSTSKVAF